MASAAPDDRRTSRAKPTFPAISRAVSTRTPASQMDPNHEPAPAPRRGAVAPTGTGGDGPGRRDVAAGLVPAPIPTRGTDAGARSIASLDSRTERISGTAGPAPTGALGTRRTAAATDWPCDAT